MTKETIKQYWHKHPIIASFIVTAGVFFVFAYAYLNTNGMSTLDDHFFHFRFVKLIRTEGWEVANKFQAVYFSKLSQNNERFGVSLFQLSLIPFTYFQDELVGLKLADVFQISLAMGVFYYVVRRTQSPYALLYTLVLLSSYYFIARFMAGRAFVLISCLVLLELILAVEKKYWSLFFVGLFHVLWHQSTFFYPFIVTVTVELVRYIQTLRFEKKTLFAGLAAPLLGMAIFPHYPANLWQWLGSIIQIQSNALGGSGIQSIEGSELIPVDPGKLFQSSDMIFFLFCSGLCLVVYKYIQQRSAQMDNRSSSANMPPTAADQDITLFALFLMLLATVFGLVAVSGRFFDMYFPGAVLLGALAISQLIRERIMVFESKFSSYILMLLAFFFATFFGNSVLLLKEAMFRTDHVPMKHAAEWVGSRSETKDIVYLENWSNFPMAYFFNPKNRYTVGMEPTDLLERNEPLFWKMYNLQKYAMYCELQKDCGDERKKLMEKFAEKPNEERIFIKENARQLIGSIQEDFRAKFLITYSTQVAALLDTQPELIREKQTYPSQKNETEVYVYEFKPMEQ